MQVDNVFTAIRNGSFCPAVFRAADAKLSTSHIHGACNTSLHIMLANQIAKMFLYRPDASVFRLFNMQTFQHTPRTRNAPYVYFLVIIWAFLHGKEFYLVWYDKCHDDYLNCLSLFRWNLPVTSGYLWVDFWRLCLSMEHILDSRNTFHRILSLPKESTKLSSQGPLFPCTQQLISFMRSLNFSPYIQQLTLFL